MVGNCQRYGRPVWDFPVKAGQAVQHGFIACPPGGLDREKRSREALVIMPRLFFLLLFSSDSILVYYSILTFLALTLPRLLS